MCLKDPNRQLDSGEDDNPPILADGASSDLAEDSSGEEPQG